MFYPKDVVYGVALSIDRRAFGATEPPGPPRITCTAGGECTDACANEAPCDSIENGWYGLLVSPKLLPLRHVMRLSPGPRPGVGEKCADTDRVGLELCWEPRRIAQPLGTTRVRDVSYPELHRAAAYTWVSLSRESDGHPTFIATCALTYCDSAIDQGDANLTLTFDVRALDFWQALNSNFQEYAQSKIKATPPSLKPCQ